MKIVATLTLASLAGLPLSASAQYPPNGTAVPEITVSGQGRIERSPDRARVALTIQTGDADATRSGAANTTIYNGFRAKIAKLGISDADVRTTSYTVVFIPAQQRTMPFGPAPALHGYVTTRELSVMVAPLANVGKVVDAATSSRATQIGDVSFDLADRRAAEREALATAVRDAREKAETIAAAGGVTLGRIRSIDSNAAFYPQPMFAAAGQFGRASPEVAPAPPPTVIAPSGLIVVETSLTVRYEIK